MPRSVAVGLVLLLVFGAGVGVGRLTAPEAPELTSVDPDVAAVLPGQRANPIPLGQAADVGAWRLEVEAYQPVGESDVLTANQFNVAPGEGWTYALVDVRLTRRARDPGILRGSIQPMLVTTTDTVFALDASCGVLDAPLDTQHLVAPDGELVGRWCWRLPRPVADKVALQVAGPAGGAVWFSLH